MQPTTSQQPPPSTPREQGPSRLRVLVGLQTLQVDEPDPWDLAALAFFPDDHLTIIRRTTKGTLYYVTGRSAHYLSMADGTICYAGPVPACFRALALASQHPVG